MSPIVDAHQHFFDLNRYDFSWLDAPQLAKIRRDYLPADLEPELVDSRVDYTVYVQVLHNIDETLWVLDLAKRYKFIAGVVGWVNLAGPECEEQVLQLKRHPKFCGVRHITQDEPDDDFIIRDDVIRGLKVLEKHNVPFDLLFYVKHLRHAATLARQLPRLPMVIDHLAKPRIREQQFDDWLPHLKAAAKFPNVYCKLSGMITEADWTRWKPADLRPYVEYALNAFGPDRCMFGSDWPVCELAGRYADVTFALREALGRLSPDEEAKIFGETAIRFYNLRLH
ncbi:MAG TPA: amidohydrolase family protein [Pirellulales bacterium]